MKHRFTKKVVPALLVASLLSMGAVTANASDIQTTGKLELDLSSNKQGENTSMAFVLNGNQGGSSYSSPVERIQLIMPLFQVPETVSASDISVNGVTPDSIRVSGGMIDLKFDEHSRNLMTSQLLVVIRGQAHVLNPKTAQKTQVNVLVTHSGNKVETYSNEVKIDTWTPSVYPQSVTSSTYSSTKPYESTLPSFQLDMSSVKQGENTSLDFVFDTSVGDNKNIPTSNIRLMMPLFQLPAKISTEDIFINGVHPESVKVTSGEINIKLPSTLNTSFSEKLLVHIRDEANVLNPTQAGWTHVRAMLVRGISGGSQKIDSLAQNVKVELWTPSEYPKDIIYTTTPETSETEQPTTTDPTKPTVPTQPIFLKKDLKVKVQVGSNLGLYKTIVGDKETNQEMSFASAPFIRNNSTLVPLRFVSEGLGAKVGWDQYSQVVTIDIDGKSIKLKIGSDEALVDGKSVKMPVAPEIENESTMVPLRFVSETLGAKVEWENATRIITVTKETTEKVEVSK